MLLLNKNKILFFSFLLVSQSSLALEFYWGHTVTGANFNSTYEGSSALDKCQNYFTPLAIDGCVNGGGGPFQCDMRLSTTTFHPDPVRFKYCELYRVHNNSIRLAAYVARQGNNCQPGSSGYDAVNGNCPLKFTEDNNGSCPSGMCKVGNPINQGTGNKFQIETDYQSTAQGGLSYRRYYNSYGDGLLDRYGDGWSADYWQRIIQIDATEVEVRRPDGKYLRFRLANNAWTPDADVVMQLEELTYAQSQRTGWLLTLADDTVEEYNNDEGNVGRPIAITTRNGLTTTLEYDLTIAEGFDGLDNSLDRVTDAYGRTLTFHYNANGNLITVKDPAGNDINYTRDVNENLVSVSYPDGTPADPNDNPTRIYHYEDSRFEHALTGITDETGNRFANFAYDNEGRAILTEHAGGADRFDLVYNADGTTTVTDAQGNVQTHHFETLFDVVRAGQIDGDICSTCGGQNQMTTYDANGFVASRTDFNGNQTTFINNSRGLETSRTEAVGKPEERTISTEWHPTFRLLTKITEPGKITNFTYDAQGRLLERTEESSR